MKKNIIILLLLFLSFNLFGQSGKPFILNYTPNDYDAESQIWSIAQDNNGIMYFGSNQDLLTFDGTNWDKIDFGNSANAVRSVGIDSSNKVFIGSVGEFGYLKTLPNGLLNYVSLSKNLDSTEKNFTDIWTLQISGNNVYFCSNEALLRYNPIAEKPLIKIDTSNSYFLTYKIRDKIFVTIVDKGLKQIIGDSLVDIPMGDQLGPWIMLPYGKDKYLIIENEGLMVYNPNAKEEKNILTKKFFNQKELEKTNDFLNKQQSYLGAAYIGNGKYAISTIRSGIVIINEKGKILKVINKKSGLGGETVHFLLLDNENQLWAGLDYGISHVEINSPYEYLDERDGIEGSIYHTFRFGKTFYTSSNLGLFFWKNNKYEPIPELTEENATQVFNPNEFKYNNKVLNTISTSFGMIRIQKDKVKLLTDLSFSTYLQSRFDSSNIWMCSDYDLYKGDLKKQLIEPKKYLHLIF